MPSRRSTHPTGHRARPARRWVAECSARCFRAVLFGRVGCRETIALTENLVKVVDVMRQRLEHRGEPRARAHLDDARFPT